MEQIKVAAVQIEPIVNDLEGNLQKALSGIDEAQTEGASIACLPELFNTGYVLDTHLSYKLSESVNGPTINRIKERAVKYGMHIIAPIAEAGEVRGVVYNTAVVISDKGEVISKARKIYRWGEEKLYYRGGNDYSVVETSLGKIGILICYDAELPEPARLLALQGAEIIFVPSAWSKTGEPRWDIQLPARALDNLYYVVGVNVIGEQNCGKSKVLTPWGSVQREAPREKEQVLVGDIDFSEISKARREIPYLTDFQPQNFYKSEKKAGFTLE